MYDFADKGGRQLALRPEGTASVVRAFVEHRPAVPWKVWYAAPSFRYERAQAGRYRQHHQLGVEAIGSGDPDLDVEVIALGWELLRGLGLRRVAAPGQLDGRRRATAPRYLEVLRACLEQHRHDLADDDREKLADHPMRVLDCKRPATQEVVARRAAHRRPPLRRRRRPLRAGAGRARRPRRPVRARARGSSAASTTTPTPPSSSQSSALDAAQSTIGGGGRYDGLVEALGGPPTPGIGFGSGIERVLLACDAEGVFAAPDRRLDVFVVDVTGGAAARDLVARAAGRRPAGRPGLRPAVDEAPR